jgi:hypothetical protein
MDLENETVLLNKDGLIFTKITKNNYKLTFSIENKNILMSKIINLGLIKLIYDLNPDIYEKVNIEKLNENEAIASLLLRHFFEDIGLPQRFSFIHIQKFEEERRVIFKSQSIRSHRPDNMPEDTKLIPIVDMTSVCDIIDEHKVLFNFNILFDLDLNVPPFAEKMVGVILNKMFIRVKQFIENIRI